MGGKILQLPSERLIRKGKKAGRAEERQDGILALIATIKDISASPTQAVEQLIKRYALRKNEALAAVQANW